MSEQKNKRKQSVVSAETIEQIRETFKSAKIERTYTISEAITTLKNDIIKMRKEGMSLSQISDILAQHNVHASNTLISRIAPAPQPVKTTQTVDKTKKATPAAATKPGVKPGAAKPGVKPAAAATEKKPGVVNMGGFDIDPYAADNI